MNNNCRNEGFGIYKFEDDMSTKLAVVFAQSSSVFTQSTDVLPHSVGKSVQSINVLSQSIDELT
jgi:hypothetical protein